MQYLSCGIVHRGYTYRYKKCNSLARAIVWLRNPNFMQVWIKQICLVNWEPFFEATSNLLSIIINMIPKPTRIWHMYILCMVPDMNHTDIRMNSMGFTIIKVQMCWLYRIIYRIWIISIKFIIIGHITFSNIYRNPNTLSILNYNIHSVSYFPIDY